LRLDRRGRTGITDQGVEFGKSGQCRGFDPAKAQIFCLPRSQGYLQPVENLVETF
jgi:hypothetical protein